MGNSISISDDIFAADPTSMVVIERNAFNDFDDGDKNEKKIISNATKPWPRPKARFRKLRLKQCFDPRIGRHNVVIRFFFKRFKQISYFFFFNEYQQMIQRLGNAQIY